MIAHNYYSLKIWFISSLILDIHQKLNQFKQLIYKKEEMQSLHFE